MLSDWQFTAPLLLLVGALFLPAVWREVRRARDGSALTGIERLAATLGAPARRVRAWRGGLLALLAGLLALAWAAPSLRSASPSGMVDRLATQKNLLLAIDVSRSMSGPLEMPDREARFAAFAAGDTAVAGRETRYEAARATVYRFVERFPDARIGLLLFSTEPFLARWPTRETAGRFIEVLEEDLAGNSQLRRFAALTNTDAALELARQVFARLDSPVGGAVIHISDAEDELENMGLAIRALRGDGIRLYTIGVGISASIVDRLSQDFAADPGFRIFRADSAEQMEQAYRLVAELEEAPRYATDERLYLVDLRWLFALLAAFALLPVLWLLELRLARSELCYPSSRRRG